MTSSHAPHAASARRLALFDLDHTLLPIDSDHEWGKYLVRIGAVDASQYQLKNDEFFAQYNAGTLKIEEFVKFAFGPLRGNRRATLEQWHAQYMRDVIEPMIKPAARALVDQHRHAGDLCAIVTATNSFVTRPIATAFGIEHLVATEPRQVNGEFTGELEGVACFQAGKVTRTEAWLASLGLGWDNFTDSFFYSDSANDMPLLLKVTRPVAVNPSPRLREHAADQSWPVLELFA